MHNTLYKILEEKKNDIKKDKKLLSLRVMKKQITKKLYVSNFKKNIVLEKKMAFIAEIKLASPTIPVLGSEETVLDRVISYEHAFAHAISYITEQHIFKGDTSFIPKIKAKTTLPVLQKDFIIDVYQIYQARLLGADALLFIARIVSERMLRKFVLLAQTLGIEPVVEVFDEKDFQKARASTTHIIAVNARNLETFEVSVDKACAVLKKIPKKYITLGFSGIRSAQEVKKYKDAGVKGVLVGTALMETEDIPGFLSGLQL